VNDAEIRAKVDVGDGGGFTRLGNNIKQCDKQAEFLKFKIDETRKSIQNLEKESGKINLAGGTGKLAKLLKTNSQMSLQRTNEFSGQKVDTSALGMRTRLFEIKTDNTKQILKQKSALEKMENQYAKLTSVQEVSSDSLSKGMEKGVKSLKRFGLSLFGIQSIWRMVSRASSAYMAQDSAMAQKMQATWVGLGSFLAPILERITTMVIRAVKYLNVFIKALTGTDFLANAMAKSLNKAGQAGTKASKQLAGFDEVTNLGDNAGGGGVDTSWVNAFEDIPLDESIVTRITELGLAIKSAWDEYFAPFFSWMKDNWDGVGKWVGLAIGVIIIALALLSGSWFLAFGLIVAFVIIFWDEIKFIFKLGVDIIWAIIVSLWEMVKGIFELACSIIKGVVSVIVGIITVGVDLIKGVFGTITSTIMGIVDGVKTIFKGLITFLTGVFTGDWEKAWEGVKTIFKGVFDTLWSIVKFPLNLIIDGINALIGGLNKLKFDVPDWIPLIGGKKFGFNIPKIPKLNVGASEVLSDGLAYLHKGEGVVTKQFNSAPYVANSMNNDRVIELLSMLNDTLENKDFSPLIDKKAMVDTVISGINHQNRVIGKGVF
jgi:hypothetical protein